MHNPEYVMEKAQNRYRNVWRDALLDADSSVYVIALDPPSASVITDRADEVSAWLNLWRQWATQHPEMSLRTRAVRTKFGNQPVHTHLDIPSTAALASLSPGTAEHWQRAVDRWSQLHDQAGQAVRPWLARIVDLDDYDFTTLLAAASWFRGHPRSGLTVRSVPVPGMHTKWLARHRSMLLACLGTATDPSQAAETDGEPDPADIPAADLDALGLRPLPREISIVLADPALREAAGGLRQITAPVDEIARLQIRPDAVLIVENKEPALAWSDTTGLAIIHSLGNHLDILDRVPWTHRSRCWYWGDLDRHGFTILSRARTAIPHLQSLLMTPGDIETYRPLGIKEDLGRYDQPDPTLTPAESAALNALQLAGRKYLRTEQERIPVSHAERALRQALNQQMTPGPLHQLRILRRAPGGHSSPPTHSPWALAFSLPPSPCADVPPADRPRRGRCAAAHSSASAPSSPTFAASPPPPQSAQRTASNMSGRPSPTRRRYDERRLSAHAMNRGRLTCANSCRCKTLRGPDPAHAPDGRQARHSPSASSRPPRRANRGQGCPLLPCLPDAAWNHQEGPVPHRFAAVLMALIFSGRAELRPRSSGFNSEVSR